MSSTAMPVPTLGERTTTTILRQRHAITALSGATAMSPAVGPIAGKRWLIVDAVVEARYLSAPLAVDGAGAIGEITGNAPDVTFVGVDAMNDSAQGLQFGIAATPNVTMDFGDEARLTVDATQSARDVAGILTFWGFEYDDLT